MTAPIPPGPACVSSVDLRLDRPTPARMYDYFLGGKDNFAVDRDPAGIIKAFRSVMAPGSCLVLSHLTTDGPLPAAVARTVEVYEGATSPIVFRAREQIAQLFDGFDLERPGLVRPRQWRPEPTDTMHTKWLYAGVAKLG